MATKRLFVGLGFSGQFARDLEPWIQKLKKTADHKEIGLKWTVPENYHVTLVFLGATAEEEIPGIHEKMKAAAERRAGFSLKIRGLGGFPSPRSARVLYLAVQRSQAILDLQSDLESLLKKPDEVEPDYTPHLTLARLRNPKNCRDLLSPFEHLDLGRQDVNEIRLFSSTLAGPYPVYEQLLRVPLKTLA